MIGLPEIEVVVLLCAAAAAAGFVDSIAGGGGLIQVPALLALAPQLSVASVLGTNKLSSIFGTTAALWRYRRLSLVRVRDWRWGFLAAGTGGLVGAALASAIEASFLKPIVIGLTIVVLVYSVLSARWVQTGRENQRSSTETPPKGKQLAVGSAIGTYDGFYGPGAGSFLIAALVKLYSFDALRASSAAKSLNLASNAGALVWFTSSGNVSFKLGLMLACFNFVGGLVGSHLAGAVGAKLVRTMLTAVVGALLLKMLWEMIHA